MLFRTYWWLRRIIAPSLKFSQNSYEEVLQDEVAADSRWIDIGCGRSLLPSWRSHQEKELVARCQVLVGMDYDLASLQEHPSIGWRIRGDVTSLPFAASSFDLVTANMVVEHLDRPQDQFREVNRILRPGGCFLFHTPNALGYGVLIGRALPDWLKTKLAYLLQGRKAQDVFKTYYRANSANRVTELAQVSGFTVKTMEVVTTDAILAMVPPLALLELLWIRVLMTSPFRRFRTNIIAVLQKSA